jgi:hypothetical protein
MSWSLRVLVLGGCLATQAWAQDPFVWTTYLGGRFNDHPNAITVDTHGFVYVVGATQSDDFPTTTGALRIRPPRATERGRGPFKQVRPGRHVGFLAKIDGAGKRLLYGTYVGGTVRDSVNAVSVDSTGRVCLGGSTDSPDLPVTPNAPQEAYRGKGRGHFNNSGDGFVLCLSRQGELEFGTYLGGSATDLVSGVQVAPNGVVYVTGSTASADFPSAEPLVGSVAGFVLKIDTTRGRIVWASRLGGHGTTTPAGIALANEGSVFVAGRADALGDRDSTRGQDAFVAELDARGKVVNMTLLGGSEDEAAIGPVIDSSGAVYYAGETSSTDLKTTPRAYQRAYQGGASDSFVAKTGGTPDQSYVTYLGAGSYEGVRGLAVDAKDRVHVVGRLPGNSDFAITPGTPPPAEGLAEHFFYAVVGPRGRRLEFSLRRGGQSNGPGRFRVTKSPRIALGPSGDAYILAMTTDDVAASAGAYQTASAGGHELVVFRVSARSPDAAQRGTPSNTK